MSELTHARLIEVLNYDPVTGIFTHAINRRRARKGDAAGSINKCNRRRYIRIDYKRYLASRLAWFYVKGEWPKFEIDHRDLNSLNDAFLNFRSATRSQNEVNKILKPNQSGFRGVYWHRAGGKWQARLKHAGKTYHLGLFANPADASKVYEARAREIWGEFSRGRP